MGFISLKFIHVFVGFLLVNRFVSSEKAPYYAFMHDAKYAPAFAFYDYIIIGGGTSGCALAATLSTGATVLLLERGDSPYRNPRSTDIGSFATTLSINTPTSFSQHFISEDGVFNARARVLGGGSVLNAGFYTRASAGYVKNVGWNKSRVENSYRWVEEKVAFEPPMKQWQSAVRDGLLEVGVLPYNGFTYEHLYGTKIGGTIFDSEGHRHTAADLLEYAHPKNITLYLHATVHKILFFTTGRPKPRAYGVTFKDALGLTHTAYLVSKFKNEVILSAGAIGSPQLLMLSGIGPRNQLLGHGIEIVMDQPNVGRGMSDNPMNAIFIPSPLPVEVSLIQVVGITRFDSYIETASGSNFAYSWAQRLSTYSLTESGWFSNQTREALKVSPEAMAEAIGTLRSHVTPTLRGGVIVEKIMGPISTGHLQLRTTNPDDNPSVTFNYFKEPEDLKRCVAGMKTIIDVINSKAFSKFRYRNMPVQTLIDLTVNLPVNLRARHLRSGSSLEQFCVDTVMTIWHYHGGCGVGKVVDEDYRVIGVDALRVIDGSTFNYSPGTNPQATLMMLGRYMGEKILNDRDSFGK